MLAQKYRFHGHGSLRYALKHGRVYRAGAYTVRVSRNPHRKHPRFAVVVSKKVAKQAVIRNSIRRKLYEACRTHLLDVAPYDIIIIVHTTDVAGYTGAELQEVCYTIRTHCHLEQMPKT